MKFSRVCGVQRVMPKGGETEGIMPPLPLGVVPEVPIWGLTYFRTPALVWNEDGVDGFDKVVAAKAATPRDWRERILSMDWWKSSSSSSNLPRRGVWKIDIFLAGRLVLQVMRSRASGIHASSMQP